MADSVRLIGHRASVISMCRVCQPPGGVLGFSETSSSGGSAAMRTTTLETSEPLSDPGVPEPIDENLHYGRAWQRYRYVYRDVTPLRVLDLACGTGRSSIGAARLNRGASVLGVDASADAIAAARDRARGLNLDVAFQVHDPANPLPEEWGRFDFVVCRGALAHAADPDRLLASLARALAPDGLLLVTIPSQTSRQTDRSFRRAVEILARPGATEDELAAVGLDLFQALRPDHPIRLHVERMRQGEPELLDPAQVLARLLGDQHAWTLEEAAARLDRAGLRFLYAATPWRWRPDRVFRSDALDGDLLGRVERLAPDHLSRLIDAARPRTS